jgi:hypothetical protein
MQDLLADCVKRLDPVRKVFEDLVNGVPHGAPPPALAPAADAS